MFHSFVSILRTEVVQALRCTPLLKLVHQASKLLRSGGTVDVPHPAVQFAGLAAAVANLQEPVQKTEHHRDQGKQRLERILRRRPTVGVDRLGGVLGSTSRASAANTP